MRRNRKGYLIGTTDVEPECGMLAVQLAKKTGLTVIATTEILRIEQLLRNGADHALGDDGALEPKVKSYLPEGVNKNWSLLAHLH